MLVSALVVYCAGFASYRIPVKVNPSVELLSIIYRLAEAEEYSTAPADAPYVKRVDAHFSKFKNHPTIQRASALRQEFGIGFDSVASFAVHLKPGKYTFRYDINKFRESLGQRWKVDKALEFADSLKQFAKDTKAEAFFRSEEMFYRQSEKQMSDLLERQPYVKWLEGMFGKRKGYSFTAIPGLLNGGSNYGVNVRFPNDTTEIMPIIGAYAFDEKGIPKYADDDAATVIHEFCHTYANGFVDKYYEDFAKNADALFPLREKLMTPQAYRNSKVMMHEAFVRALTCRFAIDQGSTQFAEDSIQEETRRGFLWTREFTTLLGEYQSDRKTYPTFDSFMPRIKTFFDQTTNGIQVALARLPKVKWTSISEGSIIDSSIKEFKIVFDRPMKVGRKGLSGLNAVPWPDGTTGAKWSEDGLSVTYSISLKPGTEYTVQIGTIWSASFESEGGMPLDPVRISFKTKPWTQG
jgi:hypothetical protein